MHHHGISYSFPATNSIQTVRLWDTGTGWKWIETSPGVYNWAPLDGAVEQAEANGASVSLVLGGTPTFYSDRPTWSNPYGAGFCGEADLGAWRRYVKAVVSRYKGRIDSYEPINEVDIGLFYCGSMEHVVERSRIVYNVVQRIDPTAVVLSPSFVDRLAGSQYIILRYLKKYGGIKYAEAISYHPYGMPEYSPEDNGFLISELIRKMKERKIYRPVWSTELNYGLPIGGGGIAEKWSEWKQSAFMSRTWIIQHNAGAKRVYWYSWNNASFLGVKMQTFDHSKPYAARAMDTMKWWMRAPIYPCTVNAKGTWTCRVAYKGRDGYIRWNPTKTVYQKVPKGALTKRNMYGNLIPTTRRVGTAPVLYR